MPEHSPPVFEVSVSADDRVATVRCSGELDIAGGPTLRSTLDEARQAGLDVVVDLTDLEFIDSSGLGVLVGAHKDAAEQGRTISLRGANGAVAKVLRITGLTDVIPAAE